MLSSASSKYVEPPPTVPDSWDAIRNVLQGIAGHTSDPKAPADALFAERFIKQHWSGPSFTNADVRDAAKLVTYHQVYRGAPALVELGANVAKDLLEHGFAIEGELINAIGRRRENLTRALSATAFVLYVVTNGSAGGYLPSRGAAWGPRL